MKTILFSVAIAIISLSTAVAQTNGANPIAEAAKHKYAVDTNAAFYFPATLFSDSVALYKALPQLAEQVMAVNHYDDLADANEHPNKEQFYDTVFRYQMILQHYPEAIALIDSVRKVSEEQPGSKVDDIDFESYILAKKEAQDDTAAFKQAFSKILPDLYNHLSNTREKLMSDYYFHPQSVKYVSDNFNNTLNALKAKHTDSIQLKDAQKLLYQYSSYVVHKAVVPPARTFFATAPYHTLYPAINDQQGGVVPVADADDNADPNTKYKLLIEVTTGIKDKKDSTNIHRANWVLYGIARELNLHVGAGIPKKNIDVVVVAHGEVLNSLLNNDAYRKKYRIDNPNIAIVNQLLQAGVHFVTCGQSMFYMNIKKEDLMPGMHVAFSAQTALSTYQLKNYVHYDWSERN